MKFQILATFVFLISCMPSSPRTYDPLIEKEVQTLDTDEKKRQFLEQIAIDDQKVRGSRGQEIMLSLGQDSDEYRTYIKTQLEQDALNLIKIETYLEQYGHPTNSLGEKAAYAPWMVIHHAQGYDARVRNAKIMYQAYKDGILDDGAISFYLGRMHRMKFGNRLDMESPYRPEDEINQLIRALDLEALINEE